MTHSFIKKYLSTHAQARLVKKAQPEWVDPMLATLTDDHFSSSDYIYEHKWDGERILAYKRQGKVTLLTRNQKLAKQRHLIGKSYKIVSLLRKNIL